MNPILMDIRTELETERLTLRIPMPGDGKEINEAIYSSMEELSPWVGFARENPTVEDTEINVREAHIKFLKREGLRFLIFEKETGNYVGTTGLHNLDWDVPKTEIGYWINTKYSGKGYMTEAVRRLSAFAEKELKMKRLEIQCDIENKKSRAVPERLDFTLEAILKNDDVRLDESGLTDTCIYAKVF
ncbi:GNAT family N-acetyltransferase [Guptibacillus algicola]|uniref:GNAT family N-acetyltransferase n=1 Tax=Guptibacillus algicola TaxID=225844 RepID=UPI001CD51F3B|nr:GNAT family N-acetyltransferase [Alkalihalobacillus algicola]MCA0987589.1 GNAT family N-acetyltransferase [Alkalihalobacillus algicola]